MSQTVQQIMARCQALFEDLRFNAVKEWKAAEPGRKAIGYMPVYVPREIVHAAGMLPVGILGGGDQLEVIQGDAYYQSYICRIPRSTIELGLSGRLDCLDGMLFPSICDVIRNLSGMWQIMFKDKYVKYFDVPQNFEDGIGGEFYIHEMQLLREDLGKLAGKPVTDDALRASIAVYNENRRAMGELYAYRAAKPWQTPTSEVYLVSRAGMMLPPEEHTQLVREYIAATDAVERPKRDNARIVLTGSFCEQSQRFVLETDLDPISAKRALVLPEQTALGTLHDVKKIIGVEVLTNDAHRQASDKFRLKPVLDEILRRHVLEELIVHHLNRFGPKSYLSLPDAPRHLLLQLFKRAAYDEQDVAGIDRFAFCFATPLKLERSL